MNIVNTLIITLILLLTLLIGGIKSLGWIIVGLISFTLLMIPIGMLMIKNYNKKHIKEIENTIKHKEDLGYGDKELKDLKIKLKYLKGKNEL